MRLARRSTSPPGPPAEATGAASAAASSWSKANRTPSFSAQRARAHGPIDVDDIRNIWTRRERGGRGPAARHSRAQLAAAVVVLADRDGLAAVSMRQVAKELGVGQSSPYRYIVGCEDLLTSCRTRWWGEVGLEIPPCSDPC